MRFCPLDVSISINISCQRQINGGKRSLLIIKMSISVNKSDQLQLGQIPTPVKPILPKPVLTPLQRLFLSDNQPSLDSSTENNDDIVNKGGKNKEGSESGSVSSKKGSDRSRSRDKIGSKRTDFVDSQEQKFRYYNRKSKVAEKKVSVESASLVNLANLANQQKCVEQVISITQNKPASVLQAPPSKDARQNYLQIKQAFSGLFQDEHQVSNPVNVNVTPPSHDRFYKTKFCPQFKQGHCQRGQKCAFAHGESQLREIVGLLYKTKICYSNERGSCLKGDKCGFAHGKEEIRENKQTEDNSKTREKSIQKRRQENGPSRNNNQRGSQERQANNHKTQKIDFNQHYSVNLNQSSFDKQMPTNMPLYPPPYYGGPYYPPNSAYMLNPQVPQQTPQGFSSLPEGYPNYFFPYYPYYPPQASGSLYPPFPNYAQNGQRGTDSSPNNLPGGISNSQGRLHAQRRENEKKRGSHGQVSSKLLKH